MYLYMKKKVVFRLHTKFLCLVLYLWVGDLALRPNVVGGMRYSTSLDAHFLHPLSVSNLFLSF